MKLKNCLIVLIFSIFHQLAVGQNNIGMGYFAPNFYEYQATYIYGNVNFEKPVDDHLPVDSITFSRMDGPYYDIKTAPPYLVPAHMKMDYEMLYFKVITVYKDWLEIEANKFTGQTILVDRMNGKFQPWSEFLLNVHSVELLDEEIQEIKIKPLDHASAVNLSYNVLQPTAIKGYWMKVNLLDDNYKTIGVGWLQWRNANEILIGYSFLS